MRDNTSSSPLFLKHKPMETVLHALLYTTYKKIAIRCWVYINCSRMHESLRLDELIAMVILSWANFSLSLKPQFWRPVTLESQTWHNLVWSIKTQLKVMVSLETSIWTRINKQKCTKMYESWYPISQVLFYSLSYIYQFLEFCLLFLIGTRSELPKEANGINITPWIHL